MQTIHVPNDFYKYFHFEKESENIIKLNENIEDKNFYNKLDGERLNFIHNTFRRLVTNYRWRCQRNVDKRTLYDDFIYNNNLKFNPVVLIQNKRYIIDKSIYDWMDRRSCNLGSREYNFDTLQYIIPCITKYKEFNENNYKDKLPKITYLSKYEIKRNEILNQFFTSNNEIGVLTVATNITCSAIINDLDNIKSKVIALLENKAEDYTRLLNDEKNRKSVELDEVKKELEVYKANARNNAEAINMMEKLVARNKELGVNSK